MDNSANCTHKRSFKLDKYAFSTRIMNRMNKYHGFICIWVEFVFTCISDTLFILVNVMICLDDRGISHYIYNYAEVSIQKLCLQYPYNTQTSVRNSTVENLLLLQGDTKCITMYVAFDRNTCYDNLIIFN